MGSYRTEHRTTTIGDALGYAGDLDALAEEMETWRDNLEERFSQTSKYERVNEAADGLRSCADEIEAATSTLDEQLPPEVKRQSLQVPELVQTRKGRGVSRSVRAGNAAGGLIAAAEAVLAWVEAEGVGNAEEIIEAATALRDQADEAAAVDFPDMFG